MGLTKRSASKAHACKVLAEDAQTSALHTKRPFAGRDLVTRLAPVVPATTNQTDWCALVPRGGKGGTRRLSSHSNTAQTLHPRADGAGDASRRGGRGRVAGVASQTSPKARRPRNLHWVAQICRVDAKIRRSPENARNHVGRCDRDHTTRRPATLIRSLDGTSLTRASERWSRTVLWRP